MTKTLTEELLEYNQSASRRIPEERLRFMMQATKELAESGIAKGLAPGTVAPDFTLPDSTGKEVTLYEELQKGPVVITFYRGAWCPYCNMELRAYQRILDDIHAAGAELIAISPQTADNSLSMQEKNELQFHVLSDVGNKTANYYDLVYTMPDYLVNGYKQMNLNIAAHNGDETWSLPVPATFVIDQNKTIRFAYVNPDYTKRADPGEVLRTVQSLKS